MKKIYLSSSAPEMSVYEVVAERGYGDSITDDNTMLKDFGSESDEFVF